MAQAARDDLLHRGIIICPDNGFNLKLTVVAVFGAPILEHNHRADRFKALRIGNVIRLYTLQLVRQRKRLPQLFHCALRALLLSFQLFAKLLENQHGVLMRKLRQLMLFSLDRNRQRNAAAPFFGKVFRNQVAFLCHKPFLQNDFLRDIGSAAVKLLNKCRQNLRAALLYKGSQGEILPSCHFAATDKKHLHQTFLIRTHKADDIRIPQTGVGNFLLFRNAFNRGNFIPQCRRPFKFHIFRCRQHFLLHFLHDSMVLSFQKIHSILDIDLIFLRGNPSAAWRNALLDMVIQARTFLPDIPRKYLLAFTDREQLMQGFDGFLRSQHIRKRPIIFRLVLLHSACDEDARKHLLHRHLDIRIAFVILQKNIIIGMMLFNEVTFQEKRFHFGIRYDIFKFADIRYHGTCFCRLIAAALKILPHAVFQIHCLPHINDMPVFILHQINSRLLGQLFQFLLNIKHDLTSFPNFFSVLYLLSIIQKGVFFYQTLPCQFFL